MTVNEVVGQGIAISIPLMIMGGIAFTYLGYALKQIDRECEGDDE